MFSFSLELKTPSKGKSDLKHTANVCEIGDKANLSSYSRLPPPALVYVHRPFSLVSFDLS